MDITKLRFLFLYLHTTLIRLIVSMPNDDIV